MKHSKYNYADFSNQPIYVGLDVHKKSWTVSIYTKEFEHKTFNQKPDPKELINYLHKNFPNAIFYSAYEAGYCGFWIHDALKQGGIKCTVVNPADVPTTDKEKRMKRDDSDSRKIAKSLRNESLEGIYVPDRKALEERQLLRIRRQTVKQQTRLKNQIKSLLCFYGIEIEESQSWSKKFINSLEKVTMEYDSGTVSLKHYLKEFKHQQEVIKGLNNDIKRLSQSESYKEKVDLLTSVPGVGRLTEMILLTELVDIKRFKSCDHLASFVGLVPGEHSSGEKEVKTGITHRGNSYLRSILIESSWVAVRKDPALTMKYQELKKRMVGQKAIVNIARKLLNRIRYVLLNNEKYELAVVSTK